MSTYITAWIAPRETTAPPRTWINRSGNPVVEIGEATVNFGSLLDPATYLRELAHKLNALAADVDAQRDQCEPIGYDAPIGLVPTEKAATS